MMADARKESHKPRACESCSRSKAKCIWANAQKNGLDVCERCLKSDLICSPSQPGPRKKRAKSTRVKVIEQKLENITSLLERNRHLLGPLTNELGYIELDQPAQRATSFANTALSPATTNPSRPDHDIHPPQSILGVQAEAVEIVPGVSVSFDEADEALQKYVVNYLPYFPFVPLTNSTAKGMLVERSLLLKTIIFVTCRPLNAHIINAFENWFRQHVAHQIVVLGEQGLQLLQAILVFYAWADFRSVVDVRNTSLLQLAAGLVSDTRLNRNPESVGCAFKSLIDDTSTLKSAVNHRARHTNDERRSVLGLFYISSLLSTLFNKPSYQEYTRYLDECCKALLQDHEYANDSLLVQLVKVQRLSIRISTAFSESSDGMELTPQNYHTITLSMIRKELDDWVGQLPNELKSNSLLQSHYGVNLVRLYEPAIHIQASAWPDNTLLRAQYIWNCFRNAQDLLNSFSFVPTHRISYFTFVFIAHLTFVIIKITRLLSWQDPHWDAEAAGTSFKFEDSLQQLSDHFEASVSANSSKDTISVEGKNLLLCYAEKMRWFKSWYISQRASCSTEAVRTAEGVVQTDLITPMEDAEFWQFLADFGHS